MNGTEKGGVQFLFSTEILVMVLNKVLCTFNKYKHRNILVYFDPDVDGLMAGLLACKQLDRLGLKYSTYVNSDRAHGFKIPYELLKGYLVIAVDFAITREEMRGLVANDVAVISLDHHDVEHNFIHVVSETAEGLVVNNQYPFEPVEDRYLSGAGVVFETICKLDSSFDTEENRAIVGITLLSDARPIENIKAREYLSTLYNHNPSVGYIGYLLSKTIDKDYGFGTPRMDRNFVDYSFSPRINALLRFGYEREAMGFILGNGLDIPLLRQRQKDVIAEMKRGMKLLNLEFIKIVVVRTEDCFFEEGINISSFIGLLCSAIKGNGKSVFAFVLDRGKVIRASFRGQYDGVDYKSGFVSIGLNAQGHDGAFGVVDFTFNDSTWLEMDRVVGELNKGYKPTVNIVQASNLSFVLNRPVKPHSKVSEVKNQSTSSNKLIGTPRIFSESPEGSIMNTRGYQIANDNCYVRDINRTYIQYTGSNYTVTVNKPNYTEYLVDGRKVKCFNPELNPGNSLILPVLEKGYINLYIRENVLN